MLVRDGDVDVRREVPSVELRHKVLVHVERVGVDVQLVAAHADPDPSVSQPHNTASPHSLANRENVVRQL